MFGLGKFKKIKRNDVVEAVIELRQQQDKMLEDIKDRGKNIEELLAKGMGERDKNMQLFYAKSIINLRKENSFNTRRLQYVMSNISALEQLKYSLDDREFIVSNSKIPLNKMLNNPTELKKFLTKINNVQMAQEEKLAENLSIFDEAQNEYIPNEEIYSSNESVDDIMAIFESGENDEQLDSEIIKENQKKSNDEIIEE